MIVRYKTAYYTFYLPCAIGMIYAGVKDPASYRLARDICCRIGEFFQIQDDFLDCFGDPAVIGKVREKKKKMFSVFCWLFHSLCVCVCVLCCYLFSCFFVFFVVGMILYYCYVCCMLTGGGEEERGEKQRFLFCFVFWGVWGGGI